MTRPMILMLFASALFTRSASADAVNEARIYFEAGTLAYEAGNYQTAILAFERAYRFRAADDVLFNLISSNYELFTARKDATYGRLALAHAEKYLSNFPTGKKRAQIEELYRSLPVEIKAVAEEQPPATPPMPSQIIVLSKIPEARISIDEPLEKGGQAPYWKKTVTPGKHIVLVGGTGLVTTSVEVIVEESGLEVREIDPSPQPASITIDAKTKGARVLVDGRQVAITPIKEPIALPAGNHRIEVIQRGRRGMSTTVTLGRGDTKTVTAALPITTQRRAAYGVGIGAAALVSSAIVLGFLARSADSDTEDRPLETASPADKRAYNDAIDRRDTFALGTNICLGLGGAAAAVAIGLYMFDHRVIEERQAVGIVPSQHGGLLVVGGKF